MAFQICPLPREHFQHLFNMSVEELRKNGAIRQTVTKKPGTPCRVSLADAEIGEEVLLIHYEHQSADTPFRASHAVYVRPNAPEAHPEPGEVLELFRSRVLSLRGFDDAGMMLSADLAEGADLEAAIEQMLGDPAIAYLHLHYAKQGCYAARVDRA